ncbi:MAG: hypothetical protein GY764_07610 [Halieaceae bacterium]|nr:hypothetical protein [Halieaceae bacterium]
MALGKHWEWRSFGEFDGSVKAFIQSLDLVYRSEQPLIDTYLWTPGCSTNIKLRHDTLKFKRFIETRTPFECWLEDEADVYPFPLGLDTVVAIESALGIKLKDRPQVPTQRSQLIASLQSATPPVCEITVEKKRALHHWHLGVTSPVIVEMTAILAPERISTVALEHPQLAVLQAAFDISPFKVHSLNAHSLNAHSLNAHSLNAHSLNAHSLRPQNYLQALSRWASPTTD